MLLANVFLNYLVSPKIRLVIYYIQFQILCLCSIWIIKLTRTKSLNYPRLRSRNPNLCIQTLIFFFLLSSAISHAVTPQIYFSTPWKGPDPHAGNHWLNAIMPLNKDPSLCPLSKSGELMISIQTHIQHTKKHTRTLFLHKMITDTQL